MAKSPAQPEPVRSHHVDQQAQFDQTPTAPPRWVHISLIVILLLIVLFGILHLTGNGFGPQMHMSLIERGRLLK